MVNYQKFDFLLFLTIKSVTTGAQELNGTSQISLATKNAKGKMQEISKRSRQVSRECTETHINAFVDRADPDQGLFCLLKEM